MTHPPRPQNADFDAIFALWRAGDYGPVITAARAALDATPGAPVLRNLMSTAQLELGDTAAAIDGLEALCADWPDYFPAAHNLARAYLAAERISDALDTVNHIIDTAPPSPDVYDLLAEIHGTAQDWPRATVAAQHAVDLAPTQVEFQRRLADCARRSGDKSRAIAAMTTALDLRPDDVDMLISLGEAQAKDAPEQALALFEKAAKLAPHDADLFARVARLWEAAFNPPQAIAAYDAAVARDPRNDLYLAAQGILFSQIGDTAEATRTLQSALDINPRNTMAQHFLDAISGEQSITAPAEYVTDLFDRYAQNFDQSLVNDLGYDAPNMMAAQIANLGAGPFQQVLDLGCGTGLFGAAIADRATHLTGVDLSENMLSEARKRGVYTDLIQSDITTATQNAHRIYGPHDLIAALDVLVYIGALDALFDAVQQALGSGGIWCFTTELDDQSTGYTLRGSGRYAHSHDEIRRLCAAHGLELVVADDIPLRRESGQMLRGGLYIARQG